MDLARLGHNLSRNLHRFRSSQGLTQAALADRSGVPRATIAKLESGSPNPTLAVLARLAHALRITLDELVAPPPSLGRLYRASDLVTTRTQGVQRRGLIPQAIGGLTLERMAFDGGARLSGAPHAPGSSEYLAVESGRVQLTTPDDRWMVHPGQVVHYRGDAPHGYLNPDPTPAVAFTLILPDRRSR